MGIEYLHTSRIVQYMGRETGIEQRAVDYITPLRTKTDKLTDVGISRGQSKTLKKHLE